MRLSLRSGAVAVGALVAVPLLAVAALGGAFAGRPHRDLPLTSRPSDQVRAKHINEANEASYDDGYEICLAAGLTRSPDGSMSNPPPHARWHERFLLAMTPRSDEARTLGASMRFSGADVPFKWCDVDVRHLSEGTPRTMRVAAAP